MESRGALSFRWQYRCKITRAGAKSGEDKEGEGARLAGVLYAGQIANKCMVQALYLQIHRKANGINCVVEGEHEAAAVFLAFVPAMHTQERPHDRVMPQHHR